MRGGWGGGTCRNSCSKRGKHTAKSPYMNSELSLSANLHIRYIEPFYVCVSKVNFLCRVYTSFDIHYPVPIPPSRLDAPQ